MRALHAQPRRASAQDFLGSVHVGVVGVVTMDTGEDRLALAASSVHHTAGRARLRGIRGRDGNQVSAAFGEFVVEHGGEAAPALFKDGSVQTGLLAHAAAGGLGCAPGARRHVDDLEVFHRHQAIAPRNVGAGSVTPVGSDPRYFGTQRRDSCTAPLSSARHPASPGQDPLRPLLPGQQSQRGGGLNELSAGEREGLGNSSIDADRSGNLSDCRLRIYLAREADEPTARAQGHRQIAHNATHGARVAKLNPADFGKANRRPLRVEAPNDDVFGLKTKAVVQSLPARRGVTGTVSEEPAIGRVEIAQGTVQSATRNSRDPIELRAQTGYLAALFDPRQRAAFDAMVLAPPVSALLQAEIVDQPGNADPFPQGLSLRGGRLQLVAKTPMHLRILA